MKLFKLAETKIDPNGMESFREAVGAPPFVPSGNDAQDLIETAGRLCYRSFSADGPNLNVTKIREDQGAYIRNLADQEHGSVFRHPSVTIAFVDVSRIMTHELVRHAAGCAYSQESGRYVRLDHIEAYFPDCFDDHPERPRLKELFDRAIAEDEEIMREMSEIVGLNDPAMPFSEKKKYTSAIRRVALSGINTNIIMSANHDAWRFIIKRRATEHAEEEIREAFARIRASFRMMYPSIYADI
jgi:thymidylate synthase (FAD)